MSSMTLAQYWLHNVKKYRGANKVAVRQKNMGIWQSFTWDQEYEQARDLGLGLVELGLKRGDRVAIIGDNDREYLWAVMAILGAGGTIVGLFTDVGPKEVEYLVTHSDSAFAFAGDQEQCDKFLEIKEKLPSLQKVIYWDARGMWSYEDDWLVDYKKVQEIGRKAHDKTPGKFEKLIADGVAGDAAMFCYTSGTTGLPKGVKLSHGNFVYAVESFGKVDPRYSSDDYVSFIPLAWVGGAALDIAPHAVDGVILNFCESPETVRENIREIAPDSILYNSRLWETLVATIQARILDATPFNRALYNLLLPVGYKVADYEFAKQPVPFPWKVLHQFAKFLMFTPLLSQFGLNKARNAFTAGAALSPDVIRFFRALGLPLRQIYGSTEVSAGIVLHREDDVKFESVGQVVPGSRVKISEEGEIMLGGPGLFLGYHKNEEATQASIYIDEDGTTFFRTGDAGYLDKDEHIIFLDRMKDMIELATGDKYSPQFIEGRLKFSPYISNAMTIGDQTVSYVTSIITVDFENVGRWAEKSGIAYTTYTDLAQKPEVYDLIRKDVIDVNRTLPETGQVHKFVLLHKEFDADEGEMTRTRKLRRKFLAERYNTIIDTMYSTEKEIHIRDTVMYQDGREGIVDTNLRIEFLKEEGVPA